MRGVMLLTESSANALRNTEQLFEVTTFALFIKNRPALSTD